MRRVYESLITFTENTFRVDARYFINGGFWLSAGQFFTLIFGLVSTVLFAHYLSESEFGIYKYLLGVAALLSTFSLTGLGQAIIQTAAKGFHGFYKETLKINFLYSLGISAAALTGSLYYFINENTTLSLGCLAIAVLQPVINTFQFLPAYLTGTRQFKQSSTINVLRMFVVTLASVIALFFTKNVVILLAAYLISNVVVNVLSQIFYKSASLKTPTEVFNKYISYAKHTSARNIIANVAARIDSVIIFTQLGAVELAIYTIANIIPEQIKGSFKNLASLIVPKFAQQENFDISKQSIPKRSIQLFILLCFVSLAYIAFAPLLYSVLFPKYESAILLSQILALSFPAAAGLLPLSLLQVHTKEKELHLFNIISSVVTLCLILALIQPFGLVGAIIAKVSSRYFNTFLVFFLAFKNKKII